MARSKGIQLTLVLDIGSASVAGALVEEKRRPHIHYTKRESIVFRNVQNSESFTNSMIAALKGLLFHIQHDALPAIKQKNPGSKIINIMCTYASPWHISRTREYEIKESRPFIFTEAYVHQLIKKEIDLSDLLKELPYDHDSLDTIEKKILNIKLNGYPVLKPFNKEVQQVHLSMFNGVMSHSTKSHIEDAIETILHTKNITHHTYPFLGFVVLRDLFADSDDFVFVDVGGEVTDITVVNNNAIVATQTIPYGKNFFIRNVALLCNIDETIASSALRLHYENHTDPRCSQKVSKRLPRLERVWAQAFVKALERLEGSVIIPEQIFVTLDDDAESLVKELFDMPEVKKQFPQKGRKNNMTFMTNKKISDAVSYEPGTQRDSFLAIEAIFLVHNK